MQGEFSLGDAVLAVGGVDEVGGEVAGLSPSNAPVDDVAAVDVNDHEQFVVLATIRAFQFGDVPQP